MGRGSHRHQQAHSSSPAVPNTSSRRSLSGAFSLRCSVHAGTSWNASRTASAAGQAYAGTSESICVASAHAQWDARRDARTTVGCTLPTAKYPRPSRRAWRPRPASCGPPSTCVPTPHLTAVPRRSQGEYGRVPTGPIARACSVLHKGQRREGAHLAVTRGVAKPAGRELPRITRPPPHRARERLLRRSRRVVRDRSAA
jgi:hypothetical protein